MADPDYRDTGSPQVPDNSKQPLRFGCGQSSRRLVHHHDPGITAKAAGNLDKLLLSRWQPAARSIEVDTAPQPVDDRSRPTPLGRSPDYAHARSRAVATGTAKKNVVDRRQARHERELLMDHSDPGRRSLRRVGKGSDASIEADRSGIRPDRTTEQLHQRALPGAILTQQGNHLPLVEAEVDTSQGAHSRIPLLNALHRQQWRRCSSDAHGSAPVVEPAASASAGSARASARR